MSNEQKLFKDANFNTLLIYGLLSVSLYLTSHYYESISPSGSIGGSLCNINSFFNCDTTTLSSASALAGIPISLFGTILSGIFLFSLFFKNNFSIERTNYILCALNFFGCLFLLAYSLVELRSLCPFCTLYYIFSGFLLLVFYKNSHFQKPCPKILAIYALIFALPSGIAWNTSQKKQGHNSKLAQSLIKQFKSLDNLGAPEKESPFRLASATKVFKDAPLRITVFSDFQCPACRKFSELTSIIAQRYEGKVNIQYIFFPLDSSCNPLMSQPLHLFACLAAQIASCSGERFLEVHDRIFNHQKDLNNQWLTSLSKELGVYECSTSQETKSKLSELISSADPFSVKSTPTFLLNGVKIEGSLPLSQIFILMDYLLENHGK